MTSSGVVPRSVPAGAGFGATANYLAQYTTVHQTLMVARVAIWNLQWQVKGFISAQPKADKRTLEGRFMAGSDVDGIDLKASVVNTAWESLEQQTCRLLLINTVALYEGWCYEFCNTFRRFNVITDAKLRAYQDQLQQPDTSGTNGKAGIESTISTLLSKDAVSQGMSALMGCMRTSLVDPRLFAPRMRVYRVFKEARNAISHRGAIATDRLCAAYNDYTGITENDIGMRVVPAFTAPVLDTSVELSWRGIIGLSDMLRRLVVDVDHSLMHTKTAELDLAERLRSDPTILDNASQAGSVLKHDHWAKLPGGPWIALKGQLKDGQRQVFGAVRKLLNLSSSCTYQDMMPLWSSLIADGSVEIRQNLRDI